MAVSHHTEKSLGYNFYLISKATAHYQIPSADSSTQNTDKAAGKSAGSLQEDKVTAYFF